MKLVVENLPEKITRKEVENLFKTFGKVKKVTLAYNIYTKKFRRMAFVEMERSTDIASAISGLNNTLVGANCISVCPSAPKSL